MVFSFFVGQGGGRGVDGFSGLGVVAEKVHLVWLLKKFVLVGLVGRGFAPSDRRSGGAGLLFFVGSVERVGAHFEVVRLWVYLHGC